MPRQHLDGQPVPPSRRIGRPIPGGLEEIILACLEKDPEARPDSAAKLAESLDDCDLGDGWTQTRARAWWEELSRLG